MRPRRETVNHPERVNDAMANASFPAAESMQGDCVDVGGMPLLRQAPPT